MLKSVCPFSAAGGGRDPWGVDELHGFPQLWLRRRESTMLNLKCRVPSRPSPDTPNKRGNEIPGEKRVSEFSVGVRAAQKHPSGDDLWQRRCERGSSLKRLFMLSPVLYGGNVLFRDGAGRGASSRHVWEGNQPK